MIKKLVIIHAITKTVVAVLWIVLLCLTTLFENILNFNVDTFDNCLFMTYTVLSHFHCMLLILTISLIMSNHMMMRL